MTMMADTMFNPADFGEDLGDDELIFDEPTGIAVARLPIPAPEPAPEPGRPHRAPRRGRDAVRDAGGDTSAAEPEQPPIPEQASVPALAATEELADPPAPVPQPDLGSAGLPRREVMLLAIVALALFTSLLSLGGLIAVGRTLAHAEADRAHVEDERAALAHMPAVVKSLDDASARLALAASRTPASSGTPPVSADDLRHALDDLRLSLAARQPDSLGPLSGLTRDGFSELGSRLDRLTGQVEKLTGGVSASRTAPRADGRGRPS
jgi:hypothetical protein